MHHALSRRRFLIAGPIAAVGTWLPARDAACQPQRLTPDPAAFEAGDLLWPKPKDAYIPYGNDSSFEQEKVRWESERNAFARQLFSKASPSPEERELLRALSALSYEEFYARYVENQQTGSFQPYGTVAGVGHVAVVRMDSSKTPHIIEAMPGHGVRPMAYSAWLATRPGQEVYHGRLSRTRAADRAKLADKAERFISRPYGFWNFNLSDDRSFYCSKLVWLSTLRATKIPLDGDDRTQRSFWLSPKQLIRSSRIDVLFAPGTY